MDLFWQPTVFPYSRPFVDDWMLTIEKHDTKCTVHNVKYHRKLHGNFEFVFHTEWTPLSHDVKLTDLLDDMKTGSNYCTDCTCECCLPIMSEEMLRNSKRPIKIFMHLKYLDTHPLSQQFCERFHIDPLGKTGHPFTLREGCSVRNAIVEFQFVNSKELRYRYYYAFVGETIHDLHDIFQTSITVFPLVPHLTFRDVTRLTLFLSRPPFDFPDELLGLLFEYVISSPEKWMT